MKLKKIMILTVIFAGLTGSTIAQSNLPEPGLTPDSPFYFLDRLSETMESMVANAPVIGSESLSSKVNANHAAERLAEARKLAERNKSDKVDELMNDYNKNMNKSFSKARISGKSKLNSKLRNISSNQINTLKEIEDKVPAEAKKGIKTAIENNKANQKIRKPGKPQKGKENNPGNNELTGRSTDSRKGYGENQNDGPKQQDRTNNDVTTRGSENSNDKKSSNDSNRRP